MKAVSLSIAAVVLSALPVPATAQGDMGFDVNVTLSRKAAARLSEEKAKIVVFASYYGDPKPNAGKHVNEIGQISVSTEDETVTLPGTGGHARIGGTTVDRQAIKWVEGDVMVNVNVASARRSDPPNILACDFIDGAVREVRTSPIDLHCYLIGENHPDTRMKP